MNYDVVVIGAGLAGLIAAAKAGERGKKVLVIGKGQGSVNLSSGCVDILGSLPWRENLCCGRIENNLQLLREQMPQHPYAKAGMAIIKESIAYFHRITAQMGYPFRGDGVTNYLLATALGGVRPTALVPETMVDGDIREPGDVLVIGFEEMTDFYPRLIADQINSIRSRLGLAGKWSSKVLRLGIETNNPVTPLTVANWLEDDRNLDRLTGLIRSILPPGAKVALPAILGRDYATAVFRRVKENLGCPLFEIPAGQPTVPGIRLYRLLLDYVKQWGVRVQLGFPVLKAEIRNDQVVHVIVATPGRSSSYQGRQLVLATGGLYGRGLVSTPEKIREQVLDLPVVHAAMARDDRAYGQFFDSRHYPYAGTGVVTGPDFRPLINRPEEKDLNMIWVVGRSLDGYDQIIEKSGLGVALVTGFAAGKAVGGGDRHETSS